MLLLTPNGHFEGSGNSEIWNSSLCRWRAQDSGKWSDLLRIIECFGVRTRTLGQVSFFKGPSLTCPTETESQYLHGESRVNTGTYCSPSRFGPSSRLRSATWRPFRSSYLGPAFYICTLRAGSSPKDTFLRLLVSEHPLQTLASQPSILS